MEDNNNDKTIMYNFIKNDMTILKMLFIEFIKKTEKCIK